MANNSNALGISFGLMSQAVSDGALNMSARGCGGSSCSLPGSPDGDVHPSNIVLSWAVSFEKLLEDPCGVDYFTEFLRSEVSAENILFWLACERFRKIPASSLDELKTEARFIYQAYLSESAPYSVNIDDKAKTQEKNLEQPSPDMFNMAQAQIFLLMKMDSYRRFVSSPLYKSCTLASVEGKCLPPLLTGPVRMSSLEDVTYRSPTSSDKKVTKAPRRNNDRREDSASNTHVSVPQKETELISIVEFGSLYGQIESVQSSSRTPEHGGRVGGRLGMDGGYCCVYLPDGSASLVPTHNGSLIRDMLTGLCEKRGFPLKDVVIYLHGKVKQPLSLDQDCSVLRDQEVSLELRVTFVLEIAFTGKTSGIVVKSSKTLQDALSAVLQKHHLKPQETLVTMVGSDEPVNMSSTVFRLANKRLRLDKAKARDKSIISRATGIASSTQAGAVGAGGLEGRSSPHTDVIRTQQRPSKNRDMDGLLDMLTRAQCHRVDDQRGCLTKEQLEIPLFLQRDLKLQQVTEPDESAATRSSTAESKEASEEKQS